MTEYRDNTLLRGLLLEAAAEDLDALLAETGEVDTTPRFRKSMAALVADPKGWAKRRQRPVWRRAARMAATILLACVLTLGILMLVSPKVYAAISQWFVYRYDTHILYHFSSDHDDVILRDYQPTYIPAGYSTDREYTCRPDEFTNTTEFEYPGPGTYYLVFTYFPMESGTALMATTDSATVTDVTIHGHPGKLYIYTNGTEGNMLIWINEEDNMCLSLQAYLDGDELIRVAESVVEVPRS